MTSADPLRRAIARPKRWRPFAARALVSGALLLGVIVVATPRGLLDALTPAAAAPWCAAACALAVGHSLASQKWRALLRAAGADTGRLEALRAHGAGLFANLFLPSLVGGDVVRAAALYREHGGGPVVAGGIADRVLDTLALALLAAAGAAGVSASAGKPGLTAAALAFAAAGAVVLALAPALLQRAERAPLPARLRSAAAQLAAATSGLARSPAVTLAALATSVAIQLGFVSANAVLGAALGIDVPFGAWLLCWPLAKLLALAPVSLGGLGVREVALASLLSGFGVAAPLAVAQSLLWQLALLAVGAAGGLLAMASGTRTATSAAPDGSQPLTGSPHHDTEPHP